MALGTQQCRDRDPRFCTHRTDQKPRGRRNKRNARTKTHTHTHTHTTNTTRPDFGHITTTKGKPYESLRHRRRPSWTCACANCASTRASSRCAWPTAWPSSCRPSSRRPSCARHVSSAPWFGRLGTTGAGQLLQTTRGEAQRNELKIKGRLHVHTNTPLQHNNQDNAHERAHNTTIKAKANIFCGLVFFL